MTDRVRASAVWLITCAVILGAGGVVRVAAQTNYPSAAVPARAPKAKPLGEAVRVNPAARAEAMRRGDLSLREGEMAAAALGYAQAAYAAPGDPLPRLAAGITLAELGRLGDATEQFRKAVEFAEDDPVAALMLSSALKEGGFVSDAQQIGLDTYRRFGRRAGNALDTSNSVARLTKAITQYPDSAVFQLLLGDAYQLDEKWGKADEAYLRAARRAPSWAKPLVNLGLSRLAQGKSGTAIATFEHALALDPKNKRVQLMKADAELKSGRNHSGLRTYQQVASTPGIAATLRVQAATGIGQALANERDYDQAVEQLNQAQQIAPKDPTPSAFLGDVRIKKGDFQGAADAYGTALRITRSGGLFAGGRSALYRSKAEAELSNRQPVTALETVRQALRDEPANGPLWHRLAAQAYFQQNDTGMAAEELRAALDGENGPYPLDTLRAIDASGLLKTFKESYTLQLGAAETGLLSRKTENGISISSASPAEQTTESRVAALAALAHIARYQNDTREEIRLREQLTQLRPNGGWDWFLLAEAYDRSKEPANARASYSKALAVGGLNDAARKWASDRNSALTAPLYRPK